MRKKSIISLFLVLIMAFGAAGCTAAGDAANLPAGAVVGGKGLENGSAVKADTSSQTQNENPFMQNGKTDYTVVYDKDISSIANVSIAELVNLYYEATGLTLAQATADTVTYDENSKFIVVGDNEITRAAGVTADFATLGSNGYVIKTVGKSVFLLGAGDWGTIWAAYDFLEEQLGYDYIYTDEILFDEAKVKNSALVKLDKAEKPDWEWRVVGDGELSNNKDLRTRFRMQENTDVWSSSGEISMFHTFFSLASGNYGFVPTAKCLSDHRNWYNLDYKGAPSYPTCLCFTRDPDGLSDQVLSRIIELIKIGGNGNSINVNFSQLDGNGWCYCPSCCEQLDKYGGSPSTTQILFMKNYLSPKLDAYVKANCPEKDVTVYMYAYWGTKQPPVFSDSQIPELKLPSNCGVQYCTGFPEKNPMTELSEDSLAKQWAKITDKFAVMDYSENFAAYMRHFDDYNKIQTNIEYFLKFGGEIHYNMMAYGNIANTDWSRLHGYLESKLSWDVTADVNELTEHFFDAYYKDASPYMKEWFYSYRAWSELFDKNNAHGASALSLAMCKAMDDYAEKAFESILKYKFSDPDLYKKLYDRINLETLCYRFNYLEMYRYAIEDLKTFATDFKKDCAYFGIQMISEPQSLDSWYANCGFNNL